MLVTSLADWLRTYGENNKTKILVGNVLDVKIGPKATKLDRHRNFVVAKSDLGGGNMKLTTINIRSFKLHTPENLHSANGGDGGDRDAATTTTTTGNTTITDPVSIRVLETPALDPF